MAARGEVLLSYRLPLGVHNIFVVIPMSDLTRDTIHNTELFTPMQEYDVAKALMSEHLDEIYLMRNTEMSDISLISSAGRCFTVLSVDNAASFMFL